MFLPLRRTLLPPTDLSASRRAQRCYGRYCFSCGGGGVVSLGIRASCGPLQEGDHDPSCNATVRPLSTPPPAVLEMTSDGSGMVSSTMPPAVQNCLFVKHGFACPTPPWALKALKYDELLDEERGLVRAPYRRHCVLSAVRFCSVCEMSCVAAYM